MQNRVIFPDFSAFQMTVDAVPAQPDATGADGSDCDAEAAPPRSPRPHSALGPDAWPSFAPEAAPGP
jgi:hypothetical protein